MVLSKFLYEFYPQLLTEAPGKDPHLLCGLYVGHLNFNEFKGSESPEGSGFYTPL